MSDARNSPVAETLEAPAAQDAQPELEAAPAPGRRLRVAWAASRDTFEDLSRAIQPLAIGLIDEMVDIVVLCPEAAPQPDVPSPPTEMVRHGRLRPHWLCRGSNEALAARLTEGKVGVLHALDAGSSGRVRRLARLTGLPYVVSVHELGAARRLHSPDGQAAAVLAGSEAVRRDLVEHKAAPEERISLVRPGVYQVRHTTLFADPRNAVAIVAGGRLDEYAPFEAVLRCMAELRARRHDCAFFLVGGGRAERALRQRAEQLGLRDALTFADRQPPLQLAGILKAADIYIAPMPLPRVDTSALLAMAAGDPVLAAAGGASDFLIEGRTAMLFRAGDAAELTMKLSALLEDRAAARALAESALEYLREHHSPANMVSAMAGVYRRAAGDRK